VQVLALGGLAAVFFVGVGVLVLYALWFLIFRLGK
jgi:hypothetical protein